MADAHDNRRWIGGWKPFGRYSRPFKGMAVTHCARAFTLIEMIVLIIIMAVLSSLIVPAYSRFYAKARFQQSLQGTVALLAWARGAAMEAGEDCVVRFDSQTGTFRAGVATSEQSRGANAGTGPEPFMAATGTDDLPTALRESPDSVAPPRSRELDVDKDVAVTDFRVYDPLAENDPAPAAGASGKEIRFHEDGSADGARFMMRSLDGYRADVEVSPLTGRVVVRDEEE